MSSATTRGSTKANTAAPIPIPAARPGRSHARSGFDQGEEVHEGDQRRDDDGGVDRIHGEGQERGAEHGEPASERALADGDDEGGCKAKQQDRRIEGHRAGGPRVRTPRNRLFPLRR